MLVCNIYVYIYVNINIVKYLFVYYICSVGNNVYIKVTLHIFCCWEILEGEGRGGRHQDKYTCYMIEERMIQIL